MIEDGRGICQGGRRGKLIGNSENDKKDIFRSFAYEFKFSPKNEILAYARMKSANADEIFGFGSDEIKSTRPPSRRISSSKMIYPTRKGGFS